MIARLQDSLSSLLSVISTMDWRDAIDILLVSYLIYKTIKIARETRAEQLLKGIALLIVAFFAAQIVGLRTVKFILGTIMTSGLVVLVILFQPELRRILERMGRAKMPFGSSVESGSNAWERAIPIIADAVDNLAKTTTGALIVLEQQTHLGEQIATGVWMDAEPSVELFGNIFFVKTPLHDGAVIMRDGKILAGACFLPKPQKEELIATHLGSRHRAAIGMSEVSDAIIIVVSEETGTVSIAENGTLQRGFSHDRLTEYLRGKLLPENTTERKSSFVKANFFKGAKK